MLDSLPMMLEASPVHRTQPVKEIYCGKRGYSLRSPMSSDLNEISMWGGLGERVLSIELREIDSGASEIQGQCCQK